jgi:hypothetical protein
MLLLLQQNLGMAWGAAAAGSPVFPDPADVRNGVTYGPTGEDYTGTMQSGGGSYMRRR